MMEIKGKDKFLTQLTRLPQAMREEITRALDVSADETTDLMRRFTRSNRVRGSIGYTFGDAPAGTMSLGKAKSPRAQSAANARAAKFETSLAVTMYAGGGNAWFARLEEFGTAPHTITAKSSPVMARDGEFFGTTVNHPGATAQPFFYPAYRFGRKRARSRLQRAVRNGAKKAFGK